MKEEITYKELFKELNITAELPKKMMEMEESADLLEAKVTEKDGEWTLQLDSLTITINPKDTTETIKRTIKKENGKIGGIIIGHETIQYLD